VSIHADDEFNLRLALDSELDDVKPHAGLADLVIARYRKGRRRRFAGVVGLSFLLLLVAFHSLLISLKAAVMNLLSVGAAYGVLVAVFQYGWGESILNFQSNGGIASWLPIFMFVILFGLSMDYHVFILSRVREAYDRGMKTEDAVAHGIKSTASVVTSAAIVMVGVAQNASNQPTYMGWRITL